jgi:hypothetical protein
VLVHPRGDRRAALRLRLDLSIKGLACAIAGAARSSARSPSLTAKTALFHRSRSLACACEALSAIALALARLVRAASLARSSVDRRLQRQCRFVRR